MMGWYNACGSSGYGWGWMAVMMLGLAALIVVGAWAVVRLTRSDAQEQPPSAETPQQILDRRLAAGEINTDDYLSARRALDEEHHAVPGSGLSRS